MIPNLGLDILCYQPIISGKGYLYSLTERLVSYSHVLSADWLFKSADIKLALPLLEVGDWITNGLGRHIVSYSYSGDVRFVGFVNQVEVRIGNITYRVGPLLDVANRVLATYTAMTVVGGQVLNSGQTVTVFAENLSSQSRFGIWERVLQAGNCLVNQATGYNEAELARDLYLSIYGSPKYQVEASAGEESNEVSVSLVVSGYQEFLNAYLYQVRGNATIAATQTVTAAIQAVLAADVNGIFSVDYALMQACAGLQVNKNDTWESAYSVIEGAFRAGDGIDRWVLWFDENQRAIFKPLTTTPAYAFALADNQQQFIDAETQGVIQPWDVMPGSYYRILDSPALDFKGSDPNLNIGFIEEVNFGAPYSISVSGEPFNALQLLMNRKAGGSF